MWRYSEDTNYYISGATLNWSFSFGPWTVFAYSDGYFTKQNYVPKYVYANIMTGSYYQYAYFNQGSTKGVFPFQSYGIRNITGGWHSMCIYVASNPPMWIDNQNFVWSRNSGSDYVTRDWIVQLWKFLSEYYRYESAYYAYNAEIITNPIHYYYYAL